MNGTTTPNEMTKQENTEMDLKAELEHDLEDEADDTEKYMKLAAHADEHYPRLGYGSILRDIAKEEHQHHEHIKMILEDMCKQAGETHE